jgi:hypothetical protein
MTGVIHQVLHSWCVYWFTLCWLFSSNLICLPPPNWEATLYSHSRQVHKLFFHTFLYIYFIIFKVFHSKIFRSTAEEDEIVFARVSEYIYVEDLWVPINAQCDTTGLKIALCQQYKLCVQWWQSCVLQMFICLSAFGEEMNCSSLGQISQNRHMIYYTWLTTWKHFIERPCKI